MHDILKGCGGLLKAFFHRYAGQNFRSDSVTHLRSYEGILDFRQVWSVDTEKSSWLVSGQKLRLLLGLVYTKSFSEKKFGRV